MAKVSVIMPAYNVAPYIGAAIESVIAQTIADWELVIVDDGSTDSTADIARAYARRDARVRLLQQANGGPSAARNAAIRHATGEFLATLDGDDLWEPKYLEAQLAILAKHPEVAIVTGNGWFLGGPRHGTPSSPWPDNRPQPTLAGILSDEAAIFIQSIMRRSVYDTIGGFDEDLRTSEDYQFWARAAIAGFKFIRNDEPLGHYRRRHDSASANHVRMVAGALVMYEKLRPLLTGRPAELAIVERQIVKFERERLATRARDAMNAGHVDVAAAYLSELYAHSGGATVKLASVLAKWMPGLFTRAYQMRRARQGATS